MASYAPTAIPNTFPARARSWLADELARIAGAINAGVHVKPLAAEPARAVDGDIVYADGSNWDPGSGEGFYGRENGAWVKL